MPANDMAKGTSRKPKSPALKPVEVAPPEDELEAQVPMPALPESVPHFTTERLQLLSPLITPRVWQLALYRFCGGKLMKGKKEMLVADGEAAVRTALVLAYEMWPHLRFSVEEEGVMRGMSADYVNPAKKNHLIRPF